MKGYIKFSSLLLALLLSLSMTFPVFAGGSVSYSDGAQSFIFGPGSKHSATDLFSDLKGVMPGDSITQKITVRNDSYHGVKVDIYMRSLGAHKDSAEFLSKLRLSVARSEQNRMAYMFDATADQTAGLTDWVFLGTLYSGGEVNLDISLDVPIELGNEYQDAVGYIDWEFRVEKKPVDPSDPVPPPTGDRFILYLGIAAVSICAVLFISASVKRRRYSDR